MGKIILTDWPKTKSIEAHYRGCETDHLHKMHEQMFHLMMGAVSDSEGGYVITYYQEGVMKELEFRKEHPKFGYLFKEKT